MTPNRAAEVQRLRALRTITESQFVVMRRSDSGVGDSGALRMGVGRSHDRRGGHLQRWEAVGSKLDERGRRLFAAAEARTAGWGGLAMVSKITGLARSTINRGEDDSAPEPRPEGQV